MKRSCPKHPSMGPYCSCLANRPIGLNGTLQMGRSMVGLTIDNPELGRLPSRAAKTLQGLEGERGKTVPEFGYMRHMGYTVGKGAPPERERRAILNRCVEGSVPSSFPKSYAAEWGPPGTRRRMHKMMNFLGGQAEWASARANREAMQQAIADWEADLRWLLTEYERFWMLFPSKDAAQ